jgi:hypothetical protein
MAHDGPTYVSKGFEDHKNTYEGFIKGSVALSLICGFVLVALCAFRFMDYLNVFTGFAGLIVGVLATLITLKSGGKWFLPGGLLVVFGLIVAINF